MAKKSDVEKTLRKQKYMTRILHRCWRCGRRRGYIRYFKICRICFRELATRGVLPGIRKSSW